MSAKRPDKEGTHGNYFDYRKRRLPAPDRLSLISPGWTHGKRVLDLGSNDGAFAISLASSPDHCPSEVVGMELDSKLVRQARRTIRRHAAAVSHVMMDQVLQTLDQLPAGTAPPPRSELCRANALSDPVASSLSQITDLHMASRLHNPGYPFNIRFLHQDITQFKPEQTQFHIVLCLSVTKWVHLYGGDAAIMGLFRCVYEALEVGGAFILEPQPWESYKRKKNISKQVTENFKAIKLEPADFPAVLTKPTSEGGVGFHSSRLLRDRGPKGSTFNRQVWRFEKR